MTETMTIKLKKRYARAEWQLDDTHYAVLSASHSKERKAFHASLRQEQEEICAGYTSRSFMLFSGVGILGERVARYSDKGLREFLDRAIARLEDLRAEGNDKVAEMFTVTELED